MMNIKAFTIVEMSIVLIVIGIIAGMAVKGTGIIGAAKVKNEIARLQKFKIAANSYMSREKIVGEATAQTVDAELFAAGGTFAMRDLVSDFSVNPWEFAYCQSSADSYIHGQKDNSRMICASNEQLQNFFICHIENVLDNDNLSSGHGRKVGSGTDDINYQDCTTVPETDFTDYMYRIY